MANANQVAAREASQSLIDQLGSALLELNAHNQTAEDRVQWKEIEQHLRNLESTMMKQSEELEAKEKSFEERKAETCALLVEREAAVIAKEQDLLDRVQELKNAAVNAIAEARDVHQPKTLEPMTDTNNSKVSSPLDLDASNSRQVNLPAKKGDNAKGVASYIEPRPELRQFCEQMDAKGLLNYIVENHKKQSVVHQELSIALESAAEPAQLVLDSLKALYPLDETNKPECQKDQVLQGQHRSCLVLVEALTTLVAKADHLLNPETKQQAKSIADKWKSKLYSTGSDAPNGNSLEAEAFLQLLSTFRIASKFDEDELCKIVLAAISHRRRAPELCRSLGLTHKMPGLVDSLIRIGKQIDAVHFIHAFELAESFPPVLLLKTYLKELRRNSQGDSNGDAQEEVNAKELAGLKAVVGCVQEYQLEADYPLDPLQKRLVQLERAKVDKKRSGGTGKRQQQPKKQKPSRKWRGYRGGPGLLVASSSTVATHGQPAYGERPAYTGMSERYGLTTPHTYEYQAPSQPDYTAQSSNQRLYYYPQENSVPLASTSYDVAASQPTYEYQAPSQLAYTPQSSDQRLYYYPQENSVSLAPTSYNVAAPPTYTYLGTQLQTPHQSYM